MSFHNKKTKSESVRLLIRENEIAANKDIARILMVIAFCYFVGVILTVTGIFRGNGWIIISLLIFGTAMLLVSNYCLKYSKNTVWLKYAQIMILLLSVFFLNVVVGYKIWLLYAAPIFLSVRYYNKKFMAFIGLVAMVLAVLSSFTNAYLAPQLGIIDLNLVSFKEPGTIQYYSWLHNAVISHEYDFQKVVSNGIRLSVIPNCIAILISIIIGNSLISNAERMLEQLSNNYEREIQLIREALLDELTGLGNRRAYEKDIAEITKLSSDFVYLSCDVNNLKTTNDTLGHDAGDEIIVATSQCLQRVFGEYGKAYRVGGDEFAVLLKVDQQKLESLKIQLKDEVSCWHGKLVNGIAVSCGYVTMNEVDESATIHSIAKLADQKMYQAKTEYYRANGIDRRRH